MATNDQHLRAQITHHLDLDLPETANFLAGRLHALDPRSADSTHLLALTHYRLREFRAAADYSQKFGSNGRHLNCAWVYAQACLKLGRFQDGINALEKCRPAQQQNLDRTGVPDAAAVSTLLGKLSQAHGDSTKASESFLRAHKGNSFTWEAFEGLCKVGGDLKVERMFRGAEDLAGPSITVKESVPTTEIFTDEVLTPDPFGASKNLHKRTISGQQPTTNEATAAPARRSNRLVFGSTTGTSRPGTAESNSSIPGAGRPAKPATGTKGRIGSTVGRVVSGNRKILPPERKDEKGTVVAKQAPSRTAMARTATAQQKSDTAQPTAITVHEDDPSETNLDALYTTLSSLRTLAIGTYATTRFDTNLALKTFRSLPTAQRETPYVLAQLGRAHYEAANYNESAECFAQCLKLQPSRVKDMEIYSTVLWHLKKESGLAFLCHNLRETASNEPETWVAVGNAFSLSREHDSAIAAFRRAVQIDSKFAYAWTLMGHEHIANEDFDAALSCFRHAVAHDRRGFGGWYGLGKCFERVGKLEDAERHYRIASSINPSNATLLVCVGVVLEKLRNRQAALSHYTKALELAPSSALARFKKARVLMALRCFDEALVELETLRGVAGEEANVWFLLGKCYKGLGMKPDSVNAFTRALGLDVKAAPLIKEAMEALDDDEDMDSDED